VDARLQSLQRAHRPALDQGEPAIPFDKQVGADRAVHPLKRQVYQEEVGLDGL